TRSARADSWPRQRGRTQPPPPAQARTTPPNVSRHPPQDNMRQIVIEMLAASSRPAGVGCQHTATRLAVLLRGSDQLFEPGIVLDVPPPPVRGPRQARSVRGVRRHLLLQQAQCLVAVTEQ